MGVPHLRRPQGEGAHLQEVGRAALLRDRPALPARPLREGHLPEVRHAGPVRRRLREVRHDLRPARAEGAVLRDLRKPAGRPLERPRVREPPEAGGVRGDRRLGERRGAPRAVRARAGEGLARRPPGLVHHARRAVLRVPGERSRVRGQVPLRLGGRAHRLPLERRALLQGRGARREAALPRGVRAAVPRRRSEGGAPRALHREGHPSLPRGVLARDALGDGPQAPGSDAGARSPHRERREDVEDARLVHHREGVPRLRPRPRAAPLLLRVEPVAGHLRHRPLARRVPQPHQRRSPEAHREPRGARPLAGREARRARGGGGRRDAALRPEGRRGRARDVAGGVPRARVPGGDPRRERARGRREQGRPGQQALGDALGAGDAGAPVRPREGAPRHRGDAGPP